MDAACDQIEQGRERAIVPKVSSAVKYFMMHPATSLRTPSHITIDPRVLRSLSHRRSSTPIKAAMQPKTDAATACGSGIARPSGVIVYSTPPGVIALSTSRLQSLQGVRSSACKRGSIACHTRKRSCQSFGPTPSLRRNMRRIVSGEPKPHLRAAEATEVPVSSRPCARSSRMISTASPGVRPVLCR